MKFIQGKLYRYEDYVQLNDNNISFSTMMKSYTLEASTDLINWEVTSSGIIAVGTVTLQLDPRAIGGAQRFYRVSVEE